MNLSILISTCERLPISQNSISCASFLEIDMINIPIAERNALTITPDNNSVCIGILPPVLAKLYTKNIAASAPIKANNGRRITDEWIFMEIATVAPNAAPDDAPNIKGSANGLRNTPCSTIPEVDNPAPITRHMIILGNLSLRRMVSSVTVHVGDTLTNGR